MASVTQVSHPQHVTPVVYPSSHPPQASPLLFKEFVDLLLWCDWQLQAFPPEKHEGMEQKMT